jgi:hypothetical protein
VVTGYGGTYRASVVDNFDPMLEQRLQVIVPDVYGEAAVWAVASLPAGSSGSLPAIGDLVWVSFEYGDTDHPVWQPDQGADQTAHTGYANSGYVGVYRGFVVSNDDPAQLHRLEVTVPDVDAGATWATPAVNFQDAQVPDVGAEVWIEYENGDPAYPRWTGLA